MLQFITHESEKYSAVEEAQMAIEGGCRWIQLNMNGASEEDVRNAAMEIIPMCRETDTFFLIDGRVDLVNELKVSGVHLGKDDMDPIKAREILGPHAIIGVTANTAADIIKYKGKDIDYATLGPCRSTASKSTASAEIGLDGYKAIIDEVRAAGVELPIVAAGGITADDVETLLNQGVNGIAMSEAIVNADDPMLYTSGVLEKMLGVNK